jgi:hypothetical protein
MQWHRGKGVVIARQQSDFVFTIALPYSHRFYSILDVHIA